MVKIHGSLIATLIASLVSLSCTYVPLSEKGQSVEVLTLESASKCQQLGRTKSKTTYKVWIFPRSEKKVRSEVEALARNEASELGGTAIAPMGKMTDGEQLFGIYRCLDRPGSSESVAG